MNNVSIRQLKKFEEQLTRISEYANNKKIGYEPKCKICNSKYQKEVEASREEGFTLEEIKEDLESKGEEVSIMSLSRHFDRHYPARKSYLLGISEEKAQAITEGEIIIEEDLRYDPEFMEELESDQPFYDHDETGEYKEFKKGRDIYIFNHGYCYTGDRFCKLVPKLNKYDGTEVTSHLEREIHKINEGLVNDWMGEKKIKLMEDSLKCAQCQIFYSGCCTLGLLKLVLNKEYGINLESEEFNRLLFEVDFRPEDLDKELQKMASREREKAQDNS